MRSPGINSTFSFDFLHCFIFCLVCITADTFTVFYKYFS